MPIRAAAVLPLLLAASTARADEAAAESCLKAKIWADYSSGWAVRTATAATLGEGEHRVYLVTLYQGNEYKFLGCGDSNVANIDLVLYDEAGQKVAADASGDREPLLTYKPTATASFYLAVHASKLNVATEKGGVATAVTYK